MLSRSRLILIYLVTAALLFTHEIDSAYWREWDLFGLPGGIQGFLAINFALLIVVLIGFQKLVEGARSGLILSLALAGGGLFAFGIHTYFLATGHPEFRLPASLVVLGLTLISSLAQLAMTVGALRQPGHTVRQ